MSVEFPPNPQQHRIKARAILKDPKGKVLRDKKVEVWEDEPIGDWTDFHGVRIALRRVEGRFEGIVPDIEV